MEGISGAGGGGGESCPICLEPVTGEAFLDQCFHRFCYHCILQWSEMVLTASAAKTGNNPKCPLPPLECPLCKTHYTSIVHDLVSGTKFQRDFLLASDGSQFRLLEAHRRRLSVYAAHKKNADGASTSLDPDDGKNPTQGVKTRAPSGVVKSNKWLPCWVRRELEALMQDDDVAMVTHHVVGVVESLQKRSRGSMFSTSKDPSWKNWCIAVAAAVRPFVFEDAEVFAMELWKFLDAGIDIAFYDQQLVDSAAPSVADEDNVELGVEDSRPALLDEDVEPDG